MKNHNGFTLIELLIVLVIMVGVAGVVAPVVSGSLDSARLNSSARELVSLLKQQRIQAISHGRSVKLFIDPELRQYRTNTDKKIYRWDDGIDVAIAKEALDIDSPVWIEFYPDGSSSGGDVTIHNDRRHFTVRVNWITGRVSLGDA